MSEQNRQKQGGSTRIPALRRRDFLKAGAAAAAAASVLKGTARAAEPAPGAPPTPEEAKALVDKAFASQPPFGDPDFDRDAMKTCPSYALQKLGEPDNSCEVVLSLLWVEFTKGAAGHAVNVDPEVLTVGRRKIRGDVRADIIAHASCPSGADCDLSAFPWNKYLANWSSLGSKAGALSDTDGDGLGQIEIGHFNAAWQDVYGQHQAASAPLAPLDEATEVIGDHMWFVFTLGVLFGKDKPFGEKVIRAGRDHSRHYVFNNVIDKGVTDGVKPPDYTKWPFSEVAVCAHLAGRVAAVKANDAQAGSIDATYFHQGWCRASETMIRLARMQGKDFHLYSLGCG